MNSFNLVIMEKVKECLEFRSTPTGGKLYRPYIFEDKNISFDPQHRQRLDHYGNDGDGWDNERWDNEYRNPLIAEVGTLLEQNGLLSLVSVDVGEKGHLEIYPK